MQGSIPGSGKYPGGRHGNPLQYSCLENPVDRGDWWTTYSSWCCKESDTTEATAQHISLTVYNVYINAYIRKIKTKVSNIVILPKKKMEEEQNK